MCAVKFIARIEWKRTSCVMCMRLALKPEKISRDVAWIRFVWLCKCQQHFTKKNWLAVKPNGFLHRDSISINVSPTSQFPKLFGPSCDTNHKSYLCSNLELLIIFFPYFQFVHELHRLILWYWRPNKEVKDPIWLFLHTVCHRFSHRNLFQIHVQCAPLLIACVLLSG